MTAPAKARRVRCRCKNAGRHFGVCKCHRHKGDTVSALPRHAEQMDALAAPGSDDVWWCAKCNREWTVPSRPHNPACPTCGTGGWWRRFV
jgi:hypothetical protein